MPTPEAIKVAYFSDVLCVWAYTAQIRLDELKRQYGDRIRLSYHFVPIFGCTDHRIGEGWQDKGGFAGFGEHIRSVCRQFPHVQVSDRLWTGATPKSSASCHHFIKAVQLLAEQNGVDGVNISIYEIDRRVENAKITIEGHDLDYEDIVGVIEDNGGSVHSIDEVAAGKVLIEDVVTPQD